jgi:hypothetical protein
LHGTPMQFQPPRTDGLARHVPAEPATYARCPGPGPTP